VKENLKDRIALINDAFDDLLGSASNAQTTPLNLQPAS